jgi:hypothetical protein
MRYIPEKGDLLIKKRTSQKVYNTLFSLCVTFLILRDPLWFNDLFFTTKEHKGLHEGHKGFLRHPRI